MRKLELLHPGLTTIGYRSISFLLLTVFVLALSTKTNAAEDTCDPDIPAVCNATSTCGIQNADASARSFWTSNSGLFAFVTGGHIDYCDNGEAYIMGLVAKTTDASDQWEVYIKLTDRRNHSDLVADGGMAYNPDNYGDETTWYFYKVSDESRWYGKGDNCGWTVNLSHRPVDYSKRVQIGYGANLQDSGFGISSWFNFSGDIEDTGDINAWVDGCTMPKCEEPRLDVVLDCKELPSRFSTPDLGDGYTYDWDFGPDATPMTASGIGPHSVIFSGNNPTVSLDVERACAPVVPPYQGDCCDVINGSAKKMTFRYVGGGCAADNNTQGDKSDCTGGVGNDNQIHIRASENEDGSGDLYFDGNVNLNNEFTIAASGDKLRSKYFLRLNNGQEIIEIHASCSAPIVLGDQFGSLLLIDMETNQGEVCSNLPSTGGPGNDCCDSTDGKPTELEFRLDGGGCAADSNTQGDKSACYGGVSGAGPFNIVVSEKEDGSGNIHFNGSVSFGGKFTASASSGSLSNPIFIRINGGQEIIEVHTSCSAPIVLGERFGSTTLIRMLTEQGQSCGPLSSSDPNCEPCVAHTELTLSLEDCECPDPIIIHDTTCGSEPVTFSTNDVGDDYTYSWNFGAGANPATASGLGPHQVVYSGVTSADITLGIDSDCEPDVPTFQGNCCDKIEGRARHMTFKYVGGGCAADNNTQGDKSDCTGGVGNDNQIHIRASENEDGSGNLYFDGNVNLNDLFTASATDDRIPSRFFLRLNNGEEILDIHASCSAPLVLGEHFGSLELIDIETNKGEVCSELPASGGSGNDCCDSTDGRPTELEFRLDGGGCAADANTQGDKSACSGGVSGSGPFNIVVSENENGSGDIHFNGSVSIGGNFTALALSGSLSNPIFIRINDGQEIIEVHTSCSAPIVLGDRFGSTTLIRMLTEQGQSCGPLPSPEPCFECHETTQITIDLFNEFKCPADITIQCDESYDPTNTGRPEFSCGGEVTWEDKLIKDTCPFIIERTWKTSVTTVVDDPCIPTTLAHWNFANANDACSNGIEPLDKGIWPSSINNSHCNNLDVTDIRNGTQSSCVKGAHGSSESAICIRADSDNYFQDNDADAAKVTISFGSNDKGMLTAVSFYERVQAYNENFGQVDYARKIGVRVTKNGTEIFKEIINSTKDNWNLRSFDFSSDPNFTYVGVTVFKFEFLGFDPTTNGHSMQVWEFDELKIDGCCGTATTNETVEFTCTQTITIEDNVDPTLTNVPADLSLTCADEVPEVSTDVIADDNCSFLTAFTADTTGIFPCDAVITRTWTVTDDCGNSVSDSQVITIKNDLTYAFEAPSEICIGETVLLSPLAAAGCGDLSYEWSTGETTSSISVTPTTTTAYSFTITDEQGCSVRDQVEIKVITPRTPEAGPDKEICTGDTYIIGSDGVLPDVSYQWFIGDDPIPGATNSLLEVSPTVTTTYTVKITTNDIGCMASDDVTITLKNKDRITGIVWIDQNGDGCQDDIADEPIVPNITIELYECNANADGSFDNGTGSILVAEDETDEFGVYLFEDCYDPNKQYYLKIKDIPSGFKLTNQFSDVCSGDLDSDANPEDGKTGCMVAVGGIDDKDFGLIPSMSIGSTVFVDLDNDGIKEDTEPGIDGVLVEVFNLGPNGIAEDGDDEKVGEDTTKDGGNYLVDGLEPGTYYVRINAPLDDYPYSSDNTDPVADNDEDNDDNGIQNDGKGAPVWSNPFTLVGGMEPGNDKETGAGGNQDDADDTNGNMTIDFGFYGPASIGDFVFEDINYNGLQDDDEPGIQDVVVQLTDTLGMEVIDADGLSVGPEMTSSEGFYLFDNLKPGDYKVRFITPDGFNPTKENVNDEADDEGTNDSDPDDNGFSDNVWLDSGEDEEDIDAGFFEPGSIGDFVFEDLNYNGIQDDGEPGVPGVTVSLTDSLGNPVQDVDGNDVDPIITGASGDYTFDNLFPGDYKVTFSAPAGFEPTIENVNGEADDEGADDSDANEMGMSDNVWLDSGEDEEDIDAGFFEPASIGDFVFEDLNYNGIQDEGEPGVPGVTVSLTDSLGNPVQDVDGNDVDPIITGASGDYTFDNLFPGDYKVTFSAPAGFEPTIENVNGEADDEGADDSDANEMGMSDNVWLDSGEDEEDIDAGFFEPASIGDFVFEDLNYNGIQDDGEPGVPGVTVSLTDSLGNPVQDVDGNDVDPIITGASGDYTFDNLFPGDYKVTFSAPAGFEPTIENVNGEADDEGADDSDANEMGMSDNVWLDSGEDEEDIDAGFFEPASIGDFVFEDLNYNGIQDEGEPGVPGVTVSLTDSLGNPVQDVDGNDVDPIITGASGDYTFDNLFPGDYKVTFSAPAGFEPTIENVNGEADDEGADDSDANEMGMSDNVWLDSGEDEEDIDAGFFEPASIGDFVFEDLNYNGIQDDGEPGVPGVTVSLTDSLGNPVQDVDGNDVDPIITGASGDYTFDNLFPGDYKVTFSAPAGFEPTIENVNGEADDEGADDSDANEMGMSDNVWLDSGEDEEDIDAGFFEPASIGDFVFEDLNYNGIQDEGEPGVPGVTVSLTDSLGNPVQDVDGNDVDPIITEASGDYTFDNLFPGDYKVTFSAPAGFEPTIENVNGEADDEGADDSDANEMGMSDNVWLDSGEDEEDIDAGFFEPASIGDFVFEDLNGNGLQDDEPGLPGITVTLTDTLGNAVVDINGNEVDPIVTGLSGAYTFDNLFPGDYKVTFSTDDAAYIFSPENVNNEADDEGADDSDANGMGMSDGVWLDSGEDEEDVDTGLYKRGKVCIYTFKDCDNNGDLRGDEPLGSVPFDYLYTDALGNQINAFGETDAQGNACITLRPGTINITVFFPSSPVGLDYTLSNAVDDAFDSDANADGTIPSIVIIGGSSTSVAVGFKDIQEPTFGTIPDNKDYECDDFTYPSTPEAIDNCDTYVTVTKDSTVTIIECKQTIVYTWTASDDCGNKTQASTTITIDDTKGPVSANQPEDITVECGDDVPVFIPEWSDNCTAKDDLILFAKSSLARDGCKEIQTMTYTAVDACGNESSLTRKVTIVDTKKPVFGTIPKNAYYECDDFTYPTTPEATDLCDPNVVVDRDSTVTIEGCKTTIVYTWTAIDDCENKIQATTTITIDDTKGPVSANQPEDITVECGDDVPVFIPEWSDNCTAKDDLILFAKSSLARDGCKEIQTMTYTAVDACGNESSLTRKVTIVDTKKPVFGTIPKNAYYECDDFTYPTTPEATDLCDPNVVVDRDSTVTIEGCKTTIVYTWTAIDDCENKIQATTTITIDDTKGPVSANQPEDITVECGDDVPVFIPEWSDNCTAKDDLILFAKSSLARDGCKEIQTMTYTAVDACGNESSLTRKVTIIDTKKPVFGTIPNDATYECDDFTYPTTPEATDLCDQNVVVDRDSTVTIEGCKTTIVYTWTAIDDCENRIQATTTITIDDTKGPVSANQPEDITVECGDDVPIFKPEWSDNCTAKDDLILFANSSLARDGCKEIQTMTYTAVDACGNESSLTRKVTIVDTKKPVFGTIPNNATYECDDFTYPTTPEATDLCDPNVVVDRDSTVTIEGCKTTIVYTWTAIDYCRNKIQATTTITIDDTKGPVSANQPEDITVECGDDVPVFIPEWSDNCTAKEELELLVASSLARDGCKEIQTMTYTAVDACGNESILTRKVTIIDTKKPVFGTIPNNATYECDDFTYPTTPVATDLCDPNVVVDRDSTVTSYGCETTIVYTWTAIDDCENRIQATTTIIIDDTKGPVSANQPEDITVECGDDVPVFIPEWSDNCTAKEELELLVASSLAREGCKEIQTMTYSAVDACGNESTLTRIVTIIDTKKPVFGTIPNNATYECDDYIYPTTPEATDLCDQHVDVERDSTLSTVKCSQLIEYTWTATDDCGNVAIASTTIIINDTKGPISMNPPTTEVIKCGDNIPAYDPMWKDNCTATEDLIVKVEPKDGKEGCTDIKEYIYTATDACGNTSTVIRKVSITDNLDPYFDGLVPDQTIDCTETPKFGTPTFIDNCGIPTLTFEDKRTSGNCPKEYTITRTWTIKDLCGNTATTSAKINVVDNEGPKLLNVPNDKTYECDAVVFPKTPSAFDLCIGDVRVNRDSTIIYGQECDQNYVIKYTWTATDDCNEPVFGYTRITVVDTKAPLLSEVTPEVVVNLANGDVIPSAPIVTASDNCDDNVLVKMDTKKTPGECGYTLTHTWTAEDDCGNKANPRTQKVIVVEGIEVIVTPDVAEVCAGYETTFTASPVGIEYNYEWTVSGGGTILASNETAVYTGETVGSYTIKVVVTRKDGQGCSGTDQAILKVKNLSRTSISSNGPICIGAMLRLEATGGTTYKWSGPNEFSSTEQSPVIAEATPAAAGTYSVTITSGECSEILTTDVEFYSAPEVSITNNSPVCKGETVVLTATGGSDYMWLDAEGNVVGRSATLTLENITPAQAGTYTVMVLNGYGCSTEKNTEVTITDKQDPITTKADFCEVEGYVWTVNGTKYTEAGTYTVPGEGCYADQILILYAIAKGDEIVTNVTICADSSYTWSVNNQVYTTATTVIVEGDGCEGNQVLKVSIENCIKECVLPKIDDIETTDAQCEVSLGSATITLTTDPSDYVFTWVPDLGTPNAIGNARTNLPAGKYDVIITYPGAEACFVKTKITIHSDAGPSVDDVTISTSDATCGEDNGTADLGPDDYLYSWPDGSMSDKRDDLAAGEYMVKVIDPNSPNCPVYVMVTIGGEDAITANPSVINGDCDTPGAIELSVTGGDGNYTFDWSHIAGTNNTQNLSELGSGNYTVIITDGNGCSTTLVDIPVIIDCDPCTIGDNVSVVTTDETCNLRGSARFTPSTYIYTWLNDNTQAEFREGLRSGTYTVEVKDPENGCIVVVDVVIDKLEPKDAIISIDDVVMLTCANENGATVDFTVEYEDGFVQPAEVFIVDDNAQRVANGTLTAGDYCIYVKDANGCTVAKKCFMLKAPITLIVSHEVLVATCDNDGVIDVTITSGTGPYTFYWSDDAISEDRTDLTAGTYSVTIVDANSCQTIISDIVVASDCDPCANGAGPIVDVSKMDASCEDDGFIKLTIATGANYDYNWSDIAGPNDPKDRDGLAPSTYKVTVTDEHGCSVVRIITISSNCMECNDGPAITASKTDVTCDNKGTITLTLTSNNGTVRFDWLDIVGTSNDMNRIDLPVGSYTVIATDDNNCDVELNYTIVDTCDPGTDCEIFTQDALSVNTMDCENGAKVCLGVDLQDFRNLELLVNDQPYDGGLSACNYAETYYYDFEFLMDVNPQGPYELISWSFDDQAFGGLTFNTVDEIAAFILASDLSGNWKYDKEESRVVGGNTSYDYSTIEIIHPETQAKHYINLNIISVPSNVEVTLPEGVHEVVIIDSAKDCEDKVTVTVTCVSDEQRIIFITMTPGEDSTYCFDASDFNLSGPIDNVSIGCEDDANQSVDFEINDTNDCIEISANEIGEDDVCLKVCGADTVCDSVLIIVNVVQGQGGSGLLPNAVDNDTLTTRDREILVRALDNDQINGTLMNSGITSNPSNGTIVEIPGAGFQYTPNRGFCGEEDSFHYFIENENGRDTAKVTIMVTCDEIIVFSGFSPNKDGVNDKFEITGIENYPNNTVCVFNRWGNQVYLKKGYTNSDAWEGDWNEGDLPDGTYFYMIDLGDGSNKKSGYVQILR